MTAKNVKDAMDNDAYKISRINSKGSKRIQVVFETRFGSSKYKRCSFWINRDYFQRTYPKAYDRH